jgi:hypothetical protein
MSRDSEFDLIVDKALKLLDQIDKRLITKDQAREKLREIALEVNKWMVKKPLEGSHLSRAIYITQIMKLIDKKISLMS